MTAAGQLITTALARARDPQAMATSRATVLSLLSTNQQVINGILGDVLVSIPLQVQPQTCLYQISGFLPSSVKIHTVQDVSGRDLDDLGKDVNELAWLATNWVTKTSAAPRCWMELGRDLLILWPAPVTAQSVNVICTQLTPALAVENDTTVVQNETDQILTTLTETLLLLKARDYEQLKPAMERFQQRIAQSRRLQR